MSSRLSAVAPVTSGCPRILARVPPPGGAHPPPPPPPGVSLLPPADLLCPEEHLPPGLRRPVLRFVSPTLASVRPSLPSKAGSLSGSEGCLNLPGLLLPAQQGVPRWLLGHRPACAPACAPSAAPALLPSLLRMSGPTRLLSEFKPHQPLSSSRPWGLSSPRARPWAVILTPGVLAPDGFITCHAPAVPG